jgi:serine protease Do
MIERGHIRAGLAAGALLLVACGGDAGLHAQAGQAREQVREKLGPIAAIDTATAHRLSNTFRAAADQALPAVVHISVVAEPRAVAQRGREGQQIPQGIPEEFRRFFEDFGGLPDGDPAPQGGAGSGFIVDAQGHIMTNAHVVSRAERIIVRLVDGREYEARLVGADANTDVAIIKVEPRRGETLPVAQFGNSDETRIGDWVIALGNPLGLDFTVTAGIVSAKGRSLRRGGGSATEGAPPPLEAYIQTDAAINPGNSGGPLVDLFGRVVGMNTAISAQSFIGHGFAVPIDLARRVASDLLQHGYVRRPRIGVTVGDVEAVDVEVYGLTGGVRGAEITSVQEGQPGARAGLRPGDVVLAIDGREIQDGTDLTTTLARRQPGEEVTFTIWRDRARRDVRVRLGEFARPEARTANNGPAARPAERIGFSVAPVTAEQAARLGLPRESGLVIDQITPYGPAAGRGLGSRQGQRPHLLRSVNGKPVRSEAEFEQVARGLQPGDAVSLRVVSPELGEIVVNYRLR